VKDHEEKMNDKRDGCSGLVAFVYCVPVVVSEP